MMRDVELWTEQKQTARTVKRRGRNERRFTESRDSADASATVSRKAAKGRSVLAGEGGKDEEEIEME